jgi:carboxymethylenebutenolidase
VLQLTYRISAAAVFLAAPVAMSQVTSGPSAHEEHAMAAASVSSMPVSADTMLPAGSADAAARLAASPRHREWVMISAGGTDSVRAWIVYPERKTRAPVVIVVHEIFGLSTWARAVADQLAAQGFIAIAPDLLTGKHVSAGPDSISVDSAMAAIRLLKPDDYQRQLVAVANWGMHLPSALPRYGIVGFCWGGGVAFAHGAYAPSLSASVVFYGTSPDSALLMKVRAPVLGLYGADDARVDATIPAADSMMKRLGRTYDHFLFTGAGHGFLRDQAGRSGANLAATQEAWPKTIAWFRTNLDK